MQNITIKDITIALHGYDRIGCKYKNYSISRRVCGIVVILGGAGTYKFSNGETKTLYPGDIALFSDESAYIVENLQNELFDHYTINFSLTSDSVLPFDVCYLTAENIDKYTELCDKILKHIHSSSVSERLLCMSALYDILSHFFNDAGMSYNKNEHKTFLSAISYIENEYSKNITVEQLANISMMSRTNFRRKFKAEYNISPIAYLLQVRIKRACELLQHTSYTISQIAYMTGFNGTEHFCRSFKKRMGLTATEYKKSISER